MTCTLRFLQLVLSVVIDGNGRVTSDPPGIDCQGTGPLDPDAGTCSALFAFNGQVVLSPQPNTGARFVEWLGPCAAPSGQATMDADKTCTAVFSGGVVVGQSGVVELVSVDAAGGNLNWVPGSIGGRSTVDLSTDGRTAAFLGKIPTLATPLSFYARDVVYDATRTLSPTVAQFVNVQNLAVSGDGRFIAFTSDDPGLNYTFGLFPPPSGSHRVFMQDVETGTVQLVSSHDLVNGIEVVDQIGHHATISDNGRWVAFVGRLVRRPPNQSPVFEQIPRVLVRDTCAGVPTCVPSTVVASATSAGTWSISPNSSVEPTLSADGRYVAYRTSSLFLVTDGLSDGVATRHHILLRDRDADGNGQFDEDMGITQQVISLLRTPEGVLLDSSTSPLRPVISADGRFVVYRFPAPALLAEVHTPIQLYDSCAGQPDTCLNTTISVRGSGDDSLDENLDPDGTYDVSADGRYVSMIGQASSTGFFTVLVRDTCLNAASCDPQTRTPALNSIGNPVSSANPRLSGDGTGVAFTSNVGLLGDGSDQDVFLAQTGFVPDAGPQPGIAGVALEGTPFGNAGNTLPAGSDELLITVFGESFAPGARVRFDGVDVRTIYAGRHKLQFRAIPGAPRTVELTVLNGAQSATATVVIQ
jgi:hypothetical protein